MSVLQFAKHAPEEKLVKFKINNNNFIILIK